jgi:hypothetical protein
LNYPPFWHSLAQSANNKPILPQQRGIVKCEVSTWNSGLTSSVVFLPLPEPPLKRDQSLRGFLAQQQAFDANIVIWVRPVNAKARTTNLEVPA